MWSFRLKLKQLISPKKTTVAFSKYISLLEILVDLCNQWNNLWKYLFFWSCILPLPMPFFDNTEYFWICKIWLFPFIILFKISSQNLTDLIFYNTSKILKIISPSFWGPALALKTTLACVNSNRFFNSYGL